MLFASKTTIFEIWMNKSSKNKDSDMSEYRKGTLNIYLYTVTAKM